VISLNYGDIPSLCVSSEYSQMLDMYSQNEDKLSSGERDAVRFVKSKIEAANWFIEAIQKRNETLMQTMKAIVTCQREFFLNGDSSYLKPMVLRDIADRINMDISTVSRACSNKYVQTQFGIFPLKYFFSEATHTQSGEEISTREIKQKLRELVDNEDKNHPITDDELVEILHQSGYSIARRTVAKYREKMGIPVARVRHQMK
jgi:RNA polymerase sigma-54 factor